MDPPMDCSFSRRAVVTASLEHAEQEKIMRRDLDEKANVKVSTGVPDSATIAPSRDVNFRL